MNVPLTALGTVAVVGVLAWFLRGSGRDDEVQMPDPAVPDAPAETPEDEDESTEVVAVTSDGRAFLPDGNRVCIMPPRRPKDVLGADVADRREASMPVDPDAGASVRWVTEWLTPGDFIAARVTRGAPDQDPWRLEVLGRDRDLQEYVFETEEAAKAALELVNRMVVRPPRDEDGEAVVISDAEFEEALREQEEIVAELATMPEPEPESERGA